MNARKLIGAAALSLLGSMLFTAQAQAENGHAYNGAFCKAYYGSQTSNFRHQTTGIYNAGAGARYVNCPVVVDEIANLTGTTRVWAHWRAANATDTIRCTLSSRTGPGAAVQNRAASRTGSGWFRFANITKDNYWGNYSLHCLLPSRGTLNTVWLGEKS